MPCNHPLDPVEYSGESCMIVEECEDDLQKIFEENKYFPLFPNYQDALDYDVKHPNLWTLKYWEELIGDGSDYWDGMWTFMANKCKNFKLKD